MKRLSPTHFAYDPRPVDALTFRASYDWAGGGQRLVVTLKRHGDPLGETHTYEGLSWDEVDALMLVVISSCGRDDRGS